MSKNKQRRIVLVLAATALASAAAATAETARDRGGDRVVAHGVQVAIDPATGKLRQPTREEALELARRHGVEISDGRPVAVTKLAGGTVMAELGEEHMQYSVAGLLDGALVQTCVGHDDLASWLGAPAVAPQSATAQLEEK